MTITALLAAMLALAILGVALAAFGLAARSGEAAYERLRLHEMMRLRGAVLPDRLNRAAAHDAAAAVRRCMGCRSKVACDEFLRSGAPNASRAFCPNAHYIERLRHRSLEFG